MAYSKRLSETEAQDFANEQAEKQFDHAMLHGDNFEPVNLISISSGLKDLFNESPDDLESDECLDDVPDDEKTLLDPYDDDYNDLENYGTAHPTDFYYRS